MDPTQTAATAHTLQPILFWLVAGLTAVCALATVVTQNIVRSATWLLFTLAGTSAVCFLLGADFLAVTQLLVYVGGTLVLVVFGVMLTAQGPFINMKTNGAEWAISVVAGMLLLAVLTTAVMSEHVELGAPRVRMEVTFNDNQPPRKVLVTPEVKSYAPEHSRAERETIAAERAGKKNLVPLNMTKGGPVAVNADANAGDGQKAKGDGQKAKKGGPGLPKNPKGKGAPPPDGSPPPSIEQSVPLAGGVAVVGKGPAVGSDFVLPVDAATSPETVILGEGFLGVGVGPAHRSTEKQLMRTSYLLPFEIVSVHLLVVLIGAAYLARAKRRRGIV